MMIRSRRWTGEQVLLLLWAVAPLIAILVAWIILLEFLLVPPKAHAHDSWISQGGYRNPATAEWCCGKGDCGVLVHGRAIAVVGGYRVDGTFLIDPGNGATPQYVDVHELIPYREATPSPDGAFWWCRKPSGERRCFFAGVPNG